MNEALIIGILVAIFLLLFAVTWVVENKEAIFDWLYDVGTAYYKFKHNRKRRYTR